jgi:hypothetical protein
VRPCQQPQVIAVGLQVPTRGLGVVGHERHLQE